MTTFPDATTSKPLFRTAGVCAIALGVISTIGIAFLVIMFFFFSMSNQSIGEIFGMLNDICVALQYLLTIPIALALYQILLPFNPGLIRVATVFGVVMMVVVVGLQLALIFGILTFEQQVGWVSLAMIVGVGTWLVITGLTARSTERLPNSLLMSGLAVPYLGYPIWAFWIGRRLLSY